MKQISFSEAEFAAKRKVTRRERVLSELDASVPWAALAAVIEPHYPKGAGPGRPPVGLARMLRMYVAQQVLGLSDEGIEDAIYDSQSVRGFVGIDLATESAPDATLIAAAPSTKNKDKQRDPQMHQSRKGNQWYFGMKAHIGVDADSGLVHSVAGTAGSVADVTQVDQLLHGEEQRVFADAGYTGAEKREEVADKDLEWYIARKRGVIAKAPQGSAYLKAMAVVERAKASTRALVEHPFHVIKNLFRHRKVQYRGLAKNTAQLYMLFGLANLMLSRRRLSPHRGVTAPVA